MNGLEQIEHLRQCLVAKMGLTEIDRQLCEKLSVAIFVKQNDYVSATTLMRLFGLLPMENRVFPPKIMSMLRRFTDFSLHINFSTANQNHTNADHMVKSYWLVKSTTCASCK